MPESRMVQSKKASKDVGSFAATAKVMVGFQRHACIAVEQDRSFAAPAMGMGRLLHQVVFLWFVVATMAKAYAGGALAADLVVR